MWLLLLCDDELKLNKLLVLRNSRKGGTGVGWERRGIGEGLLNVLFQALQLKLSSRATPLVTAR